MGLRKEGSLILMAGIFVMLPFLLPYRALATEVLIFALATIAFDFLLGYTGIMMFCQASFFGSGAYISGLLIHHFQPNIFLCMGASLAGVALLALFFGYMSTRRIGAYCVLLTLGLQ